MAKRIISPASPQNIIFVALRSCFTLFVMAHRFYFWSLLRVYKNDNEILNYFRSSIVIGCRLHINQFVYQNISLSLNILKKPLQVGTSKWYILMFRTIRIYPETEIAEFGKGIFPVTRASETGRGSRRGWQAKRTGMSPS